MHFRDDGPTDRFTVLLLHGQMLDGEVFGPLRDRLALTRRVLVPDLPGHGQTPLRTPWSFDGLRTDLERELLACGLHRVDVVGFSLGAYHALALTLGERVQVRKLYLLGAVAGIDPPVAAALAALARGARERTVDIANLFIDLAFPPDWAETHREQVRAIEAAARRVAPETTVAELEGMSRMPDLRGELQRIRAEALLRSGDADRNTPLAWSEEIASRIPGARLEIANGVGHLYLVQDAAATVASAESFLLDG